MNSPPTEKRIEVTKATPGYAHTRFDGTYTGPVTRADIQEKFRSPFGGRWGSFGGGSFSYIRHDD